MTRLARLHARLATLLRRRRLARLTTACSGVLTVAIASLWALFLLDRTLQWERGPRLAGLLLAVSIVALALRRSLLRAVATRETETDVALWVESRQQLDSDLVAALQFEPPSAAAWGSRQLELAIVGYVGEFSETLRVAPERPSRASVAGGLALAIMIAASALCVVTHHESAAVFLDRLLLRPSHYPTRTRIVSVTIDRRDVSSDENEQKYALGEPLQFEVRCAGELPASGRAVLTNTKTEDTTTIELKRSAEFIPLQTEADGTRRTEFIPFESDADGTRSVPAAKALYVGHLPRLVDSIQYQVVVGDAWTDPARVFAVPAPVLTVSLRPRPPDYAASDESQGDAASGATRIAVLEGSRVELEVVSMNKRLEQVTLQLGERSFLLQPSDDFRRRWRLNVAGTPLEHVADTLPFTVRATDVDSLQLPQPLSGTIGVKTDQPPRVVASAVTQEVLPEARPTIHYAARDDYGLAGLGMRRELLRPGEGTREDLLEIPVEPSHAKSIEGTLTLALDELRLVKGDQLRVTFEATDFRGAGDGKPTTSEPIVLRVTDARGVLAALTEADERLESEMERIIEQQLGAEGKP
ncbi:MAG TPA: hypothetical protein VGX78_16415 [Pirellulales bacterium]|nr:hypothetical protein [Pirellulales bacterium]